MIDRAKSSGLELQGSVAGILIRPEATGELRNSMTLRYRIMVPYVRPVTGSNRAPSFERIDPATYERKKMVNDYRPENVP